MTRMRPTISRIANLVAGLVVFVMILHLHEGPPGVAAQTPSKVAPFADAGYISGVVTSAKGTEAGVWVIAETNDLPTKYRKIVVTDDRGRFILPDLPKANYKIWVRGYGLVDSEPVVSAPGKMLDLKALVAPNSRAAAQYYPGDYWYSLVRIPAASAFPMEIRRPATSGADQSGNFGPARDTVIQNQPEWIFDMKRGCQACHQMGNKATRELLANLGQFNSSVDAWARRIMSGQVGPQMMNSMNAFGHDRGLAMFADWTDRIAAGEVPSEPPRPMGVERNVVITLWDFDTATSFVHDVTGTDERNPVANANGMIYGPDWSAGAIAVLDPKTGAKKMVNVPLRDENDRKKLRTWSPQTIGAPSPYWGNQIVWSDPVNPMQPHMDSKGRVWFNAQTRADNPAYCKSGSNNPFTRNFPLDQLGKGVDYYDPATGEITTIDLCFGTQHSMFANDKDETLYFSLPSATGGIGWIKTRVWDETHDAEKSQGWCPAVIDYNGDGKTGAYTKANEPADPKLDRAVGGANGYGLAVNPVDGSVWYAAGVFSGASAAVPGKIIRMTPGNNPPATCMTEVYEPPFDNPGAAGKRAYFPQGIDFDTNGLVWTALTGSNDLASFDRRKCKVLNGPMATGQHCPEGWRLYPVPGPTFKGTDVKADYFYYNWVDRFNTFGLGKNVPIIDGTGSDSLIAFLPDTKKWITIRVPYPIDFYTRSVEGRIDDPNTGWKGRGLWAADEERVIWHVEGGKGATSFVAHFQLRPDPLAK